MSKLLTYSDFLFETTSDIKLAYKQLTKDKFLKILSTECKNHDFNAQILYRGFGATDKYMLFNPQDLKRISRNVGNFHTLLIDNLPNWSNYPKREKAIICTNSKATANAWGNLYVIIPFDNAKLGICPAGDLADSFTEQLQLMSLGSFNIMLHSILDIKRPDYLNIDFKTLKQLLIKININNVDKDTLANFSWSGFFKQWLPNENLFDLIKRLFTPFHFKLCKQDKLSEFSVMLRNEIWTDSKCLVIHNSEYLNLIKNM